MKYLIISLALFFCCPAIAQEQAEYKVSPNEPWGDISQIPDDSNEPGFFRSVLLYFPNRILDLIDIFKADVGVGPSLGAVVRITKYGQAGARTFAPGSVRMGLLGRRVPVMLESSDEIGIGPSYSKSKVRKICWDEVGAGADVLVAGAYLGVCPDEFIDFLGGIFLLDYKDDDLK